jgi:urease accessory protein
MHGAACPTIEWRGKDRFPECAPGLRCAKPETDQSGGNRVPASDGSSPGASFAIKRAGATCIISRRKTTSFILNQLKKMTIKSAVLTKAFHIVLPCTILALLGTPAMAHDGAHTSGLLSGLLHPLAGADHLLAMVAVGLWAAAQKPAARRWLPALFPLAMLLGALTAAGGVLLAGMESLIALSVVILGILAVCAVRMPAWAGGLLLAVFAVAHGQAHGLEMPADISSLSYFIGFSMATVLLHLAGMLAASHAGRLASRTAGLGIALAGAWLMLG